MLWQPIFIIALYIKALWRDFICTKICVGHAKKSSKWFKIVRQRKSSTTFSL
jgi:hypothetical protein